MSDEPIDLGKPSSDPATSQPDTASVATAAPTPTGRRIVEIWDSTKESLDDYVARMERMQKEGLSFSVQAGAGVKNNLPDVELSGLYNLSGVYWAMQTATASDRVMQRALRQFEMEAKLREREWAEMSKPEDRQEPFREAMRQIGRYVD